MTLFAEVLMVIGGLVALIAAVGVLRFDSPYARFHAAGKASPVALMVAAAGGAIELGWSGTAYLTIAVAAMTLTLPVGVHLLFRAVHRSSDNDHLVVDQLAPAERTANRAPEQGPSS